MTEWYNKNLLQMFVSFLDLCNCKKKKERKKGGKKVSSEIKMQRATSTEISSEDLRKVVGDFLWRYMSSSESF